MIYFDSTATTKPNKDIIELYNKISNEYWHNPSSAYNVALKANNLLLKSQDVVKETLGLKEHNVIFTSGATEANNLAIFGVCNNYLNTNKRVITTKIEHPSVYNVFKKLETLGFDVVYLDVNSAGLIDLEQLKASINKETILVSVMWVNNIIGSIQPINEVVQILKEYPRCKLHVDAVQGLGKIKPNFDFNQVDLFTMSSHKLEGLKGSGALIYHNKTNLYTHIVGAEQQLGIKPGTIDLASSVCTAKTIQNAIKNQSTNYQIVKELNQYLENQIKDISKVTINTNTLYSSPYIFNISIKDINAETIMHYLEQKEIYISIGSACGSKTKKPEKTIYAMTHDFQLSTTSIRISLSIHNTKEEIDEFIKELKFYINK